MSDEDRFLDDDEQEGGEDVEVGKRVGILPAFVIRILQIAAIALGALILVVTVSVITFNILIKGRASTSPKIVSPEYSDKKEIYAFFSNVGTVRGRTQDDPPQTFSATVVIGYEKENGLAQNELIERVNQLKNLILKYLSSKRADQLGPAHYSFLEEELKRKINDIMVERIEEVLFTELQTF